MNWTPHQPASVADHTNALDTDIFPLTVKTLNIWSNYMEMQQVTK